MTKPKVSGVIHISYDEMLRILGKQFKIVDPKVWGIRMSIDPTAFELYDIASDLKRKEKQARLKI